MAGSGDSSVRTIRAATRGSALARWQTDHVADLVHAVAAPPEGAPLVEAVVVETTADMRQDIQIWEMGGKGAFVKEVQAAVLDGRADCAVHSAKDLPSETPAGLVIAAVPRRADPFDVLVGSTLGGLGPGAPVATGSARRRAQLAWLRPDLTFPGLRGNIATRLEKIPDGGAIVMAAAAIDRLALDLSGTAHERLGIETMVPQVGQGALAVECREDDLELRAVLEAVEDPPTRMAVDAERAFLAELGGDCDLPAGAFAEVDASGNVTVHAVLASLDGHVLLRHDASGTLPHAVGRTAARFLLDDAGGSALLDR
jgi:hydroxymethylbilane synthase